MTGNFEPLDLRSNRDTVVTDLMCGSTAALRQQVAQTLARADHVDGTQQSVAAPEPEPWLIQPFAFDALHRKRDGSARADRVKTKFIAALGRSQHRVAIANAAQRSQREQALILHADSGLSIPVNMLATNRASHAALSSL